MSGPPKDISPSALWLALQEMPRPSTVVDFPRTGIDGKPVGQLRIWVLTQEEQMICTAAAEKFCRDHLKDAKKDDLGYESLYSNAVCVEVLFRACRDAEDVTRSAFPTPKQIREILTADECGTLFNHYLTIQLELGPTAKSMSDEEIEAWIMRIGEGGSAFPFDSLGWEMQRVLLLSMAVRIRSWASGTISVGSQPEELPPSDNPAPDDTQ